MESYIPMLRVSDTVKTKSVTANGVGRSCGAGTEGRNRDGSFAGQGLGFSMCAAPSLMGFARFRTRNTVVSRVSARTHLPLPVPGYTTDTLQLGG
jgi:hypothetical protein